MTKFTSALLALGIVATTFTACKKDDSGDNNNQVELGKMTYKVDGKAKSTSLLLAIRDSSAIGIYGTTDSTEQVLLAIENFHGKGDYTVDGEHVVLSYAKGSNQQSVYIGTTGTIKITASSDNAVEGTFSGSALNTANNKVEITEGKFNSTVIESDEED